jgi:putative ABC transport system permease protein
MLSFADLLHISIRQAFWQRKRYAGVLLAIAFGTLGFIVVNTMGRDVKRNLNRDLDLLGGATLIKVYFRYAPDADLRMFFKDQTVDAIRRLPGVETVSRLVTKMPLARTDTATGTQWFALVGVDSEFWSANSFQAVRGRLFTREAVEERRTACVVGAELAKKIFGSTDVAGRLLPIDRDLYLVSGVVDGVGVGDRNQYVFIPITTACDRMQGLTPQNRLYVRCRTWDDVPNVAEALRPLVGRLQSDDGLELEVKWEQLKHVRRIVWWVELFIHVSIVATLGLGGFGIWHGMMSAVRARTREIGLKKAMGAEDRDILSQFLTEALCLSVVSAVLGIAAARGTIEWIGRMLRTAPPYDLFLIYLGLSLAFCVVLGLVAGLVPSLRASRMEVVSAIRYE